MHLVFSKKVHLLSSVATARGPAAIVRYAGNKKFE